MNRKRELMMAAMATTALFVLAAFGASSASAAHELTNSWYTGSYGQETKLVGTKTIQMEALGNSILEVPYYGLKLSSTGTECVGCVIQNVGSEARLTGKLRFTGFTSEGMPCSVTTTLGGKPNSIETKPLVAPVFTNGSKELWLEFHPEVGTTLGTVILEGPSCVMAGTYKLTGALDARYHNPKHVYEPVQQLEFTHWETALQFGAKEASFLGAAKASLSPAVSFGLG